MSHSLPTPPIFEMVGLGALALLAALMISNPADGAELPPKLDDPDLVLVENNGGGIVEDFIALRNQWERDGTQVVIAGSCASACTLFTALPHVCVEPGAKLSFHAPFVSINENVRAYDNEYTAWFTKQYPKAIQKWIANRGGLTHEWLTLKGTELTRYVPSC
ncbi:hypothetical protein [Mesorhizobium sp.]|uniref:hypothetical protein n=1 Tax=Mesorhizobium sp. TaxID=1871066 RepID=UPI000FE80DEB|nr:hypothetical protein [Mesorhizobium sp.]RWO57037.1 MAG: hypothetical protein EOS14_24495 [Mesorhizobium sp.]